jgi:hypothetical protein
MSGKQCSHCKVGWMTKWRARFDGVWYIVWYCAICQHSESEPEEELVRQ